MRHRVSQTLTGVGLDGGFSFFLELRIRNYVLNNNCMQIGKKEKEQQTAQFITNCKNGFKTNPPSWAPEGLEVPLIIGSLSDPI